MFHVFSLIDLGRFLPPTQSAIQGNPIHLYQLFRSEYLVWRAEQGMPALSADAFGGFSGGMSDASMHNERVRQAYNLLQSQIMPSFVDELIGIFTNIAIPKEDELTMDLHISHLSSSS